MDTLREIIQFVTKNKVKHIEVLGNPTENKSKAYQLYEGIADGIFTTDEEAAAHFFNAKPSSQSYKNLKTQVKNKLLNTVFFIDVTTSHCNEYDRLLYTLPKKWAAAKILLHKGAIGIGIPLCKNILKQALRAELTELSIDTLKYLRNHYGTRSYDSNLFNDHDRLLSEQLKLREKELLAEGLYYRLSQNFIKNKVSKMNLIQISEEYSNLLKGTIQESSSSRTLVFSGMVEVTKFMSLNDYRSVIKVCESLLNLLEKKPLIRPAGIIIFLFQKITSHTQLKQYQQGQASINQLFTYLDEGTFNWFKGQELYLYLSLHTNNYQQAYDIFNETYPHKGLKKLPATIKETWEIFRAYLHFLIAVNKIQAVEGDPNFKKFRIARFVNEVPTFSQDKRGFNIAILVIQIIFSIQQKKYGVVIDRMEAIEKYSTRYLKKDENFRSNCFIKMLLEVPKADFHPVAVQRKTAKFAKRISEMPLDLANQTHSLEVLPYEDLWALTLETL